jgi:hypothetical protein
MRNIRFTSAVHRRQGIPQTIGECATGIADTPLYRRDLAEKWKRHPQE